MADRLDEVEQHHARFTTNVADVEWLIEEVERLRSTLQRGCVLVNEMDLLMPEQATEDNDGWIVSYRIPVGPWHRILGWARQ